jgi:hypothetical protein
VTCLPLDLDDFAAVVTASVAECAVVHLPDAWDLTACRQPLAAYGHRISAGHARTLSSTFCATCWPVQIGASR